MLDALSTGLLLPSVSKTGEALVAGTLGELHGGGTPMPGRPLNVGKPTYEPPPLVVLPLSAPLAVSSVLIGYGLRVLEGALALSPPFCVGLA